MSLYTVGVIITPDNFMNDLAHFIKLTREFNLSLSSRRKYI